MKRRSFREGQSIAAGRDDDLCRGQDDLRTSFVGEMRLAAAVKWYEMHEISQAKAAEIAGLSRSEFLSALTRFGVSPFQYDADEVVAEVRGE